jgi:transcriptional regulator with XRE-family HTH domain
MFDDSWKTQLQSLGNFIRAQRQRANLSLREMAELANVSNPYLSQIERGLHEPSVRVLKAIAGALDMSADALLAQAGLLERQKPTDNGAASDDATRSTEMAIRMDAKLSDEQKDALIAVYRSFLATPG